MAGNADVFVSKVNTAGSALVYSTYLGGSGLDVGYSIAVDGTSQAYVTGRAGAGFPLTATPLRATAQGSEAFVTKLNAQGNGRIYSTYLGGNGDDFGYGIATDSAGNAYVTGATASTNFLLQSPFQSINRGAWDVFVTKLNALGNGLLFSTYLGGSGEDRGYALAVDSIGQVHLTGATTSTNFPTLNPRQGTNSGSTDAFVSKLTAQGNALVYSTYLGGSGVDQGNSIAVDSGGNAYIAGTTRAANFPTANALQTTLRNFDGFVTKLNAQGTALVYSTYLGGTGDDFAYGIAVDSAGSPYITGITTSRDFPIANAAQSTHGGSWDDAYVTKLNAQGNGLVYSTYLGGIEEDRGHAIAVDSAGQVYITGSTASVNFPLNGPLQSTLGGGKDGFVVKLNAQGNGRVYSSYLGGSVNDYGRGIAVDTNGNAYITGETYSSDFPRPNALQATLAGNADVFVSKVNAAGSALVYSTYLGGSGRDIGYGIAVSSGQAYVTGVTTGSFPLATPLDATSQGDEAFVTKLNAQGSKLVFSTYLGGSGNDYGYGIGVDNIGNAYVTGATGSTNFPLAVPRQATSAGGLDVFIANLNAAGTALYYSTYLGGSGDDQGYAIAVSHGDAYVTGATLSPNFTTVNASQPTSGGGADAFVVKYSIAPPTPPEWFTPPPHEPQMPPTGGSAPQALPNIDRSLPDLDVQYIGRTPRYPWCYSYKKPNADCIGQKQQPSAGETVTFHGYIANRGGRPTGPFTYSWYIDGVRQSQGTHTGLEAGSFDNVLQFSWTWATGPHTVALVLDENNAVVEVFEASNLLEVNNRVEDRTDALAVGVYVEASVDKFFNDHAWKAGRSANSYDDWMQGNLRDWIEVFVAARHPLTPNGIIERVRLDKVVRVGDEGEGLGCGQYVTNFPADDREIDLIWGFPARYVKPSCGVTDPGYANPDGTPKNGPDGTLKSGPLARDVALLHELSHARYLIDLYALNIDAQRKRTLQTDIQADTTTLPLSEIPPAPSGEANDFTPPTDVIVEGEIIKCTGVSGNSYTNCTRGTKGTRARAHSTGAIVFREPIYIVDGQGNALAGTTAMPLIQNSFFYLNTFNARDLMAGGPFVYSEHSAYAWNRIAGRRPVAGNANAPGNLGEYIYEIPQSNLIEVRYPDGRLITNAQVAVYRAKDYCVPQPAGKDPVCPAYGKTYEEPPDLVLTTDVQGRADVGAYPFGIFGNTHDLGPGGGQATLALKITVNGRVGVEFLDVAPMNLAYWRGQQQGVYRVTFRSPIYLPIVINDPASEPPPTPTPTPQNAVSPYPAPIQVSEPLPTLPPLPYPPPPSP